MGHELDATLRGFPAYADLTQTQAWTQPTARVRADTDEAARATEVSQGSRYTEGPLLGQGGMGKVVLARDARIGRDVAVKVLHPERELEPEDRARFLREAQVQGQLEHPSIVPVYDIDRRDDGTTFFTMRRVLGRTLAAILDDLRTGVPSSKARYTQRELLTAFATVCLTVDYAHSRGVVHRDLKPANIMLGDFGEVYVLDWGLARMLDDTVATDEPPRRLSMPGELLGTPMYMAPEQMADPDVGPAADVYALGMILFELLTYERARDPAALFAPVEARPSVRAPHRQIAPELETICVRATEGDPADRYPSPRAMQEAINRYLEGDRETEQRRALSSAHVKEARVALGRSVEAGVDAERERGSAMTHLARAVALDPANEEHVAMFGELMATPPARMPEEVRREVREESQRLVHVGAKQSLIAMLSWWVALPVMLWIGFHDASQLVWLAAPVLLITGASLVMMLQRVTSVPLQYASIALLMISSMMAGRMYGPFILMPAMVCSNAIVLQAHPVRALRRWSAIVAATAIVAGIALEWTGAWSTSYAFEHGLWTIRPQLLELPREGTFALLAVASLAVIVIPCRFIAGIRAQLDAAQYRLSVQAWQWKQLGRRLVEPPTPRA